MTAPKRRKRNGKATVRRTATIAAEISRKLDTLADRKKVSVSWLIGRAIEQLLEHEDSA